MQAHARTHVCFVTVRESSEIMQLQVTIGMDCQGLQGYKAAHE
jgi:hypothetical protein